MINVLSKRRNLFQSALSKSSIGRIAQKAFCTAAEDVREQMEYDVVTIGAGPAGLAAAIRVKQLSIEKGVDLSVCVVEKGAEVGAHILSGNVFESRALTELIPDWKEQGAPVHTLATEDNFLVLLDDKKSVSLPNALLPPQLHNVTGDNYIISLSQLVRWLGEKAEELGVEIYPGFAADEVLYEYPDGDESKAPIGIRGIATKDVGIDKNGERIEGVFARGMELLAKQTLFAEGCRGSCTEEITAKFGLRSEDPQADKGMQQSYGLGIKEVWEVPESQNKPGYIQHSLGWPLQDSPMSPTYGGTFLYHLSPTLVALGLVVGLDYKNPYLSPYQELQRIKHHPEFAKHLENGRCIAYGARVLNEGGYHAIPSKLSIPGGMILGCSAGLLNAVKIKGTHTAMKSGMLAAEALYPVLAPTQEEAQDEPKVDIAAYDTAVRESWIGKELYVVRNTHGAFHKFGLMGGMVHTALSCFITQGKEPWTLPTGANDADSTMRADQCTPIEYPKPDGVLSFDLLTNLQRSGTNHNGNQPAHLKVKRDLSHVPSDISIKDFAGPEQRFCPAGVYEYSDPVEVDGTNDSGATCKVTKRNLVINAQNCVHCKCCSIKTPQQYINWTVPEGGGGPNYQVM